jgi:hypothetical protein
VGCRRPPSPASWNRPGDGGQVGMASRRRWGSRGPDRTRWTPLATPSQRLEEFLEPRARDVLPGNRGPGLRNYSRSLHCDRQVADASAGTGDAARRIQAGRPTLTTVVHSLARSQPRIAPSPPRTSRGRTPAAQSCDRSGGASARPPRRSRRRGTCRRIWRGSDSVCHSAHGARPPFVRALAAASSAPAGEGAARCRLLSGSS